MSGIAGKCPILRRVLAGSNLCVPSCFGTPAIHCNISSATDQALGLLPFIEQLLLLLVLAAAHAHKVAFTAARVIGTEKVSLQLCDGNSNGDITGSAAGGSGTFVTARIIGNLKGVLSR